MRQLYLHIGLHKTGTSFLQALLIRNMGLLEENGLAVPPPSYKNAHNQFAHALLDGGAASFLQRINWQLGERQVISSERLGSLLSNQSRGLAKQLAELARKDNIGIKIILWLRRQDSLKESVFAEAVKTWYEGTILEEQHYDYDFNGRVEGLERAFGMDNINIGIQGGEQSKPLSEAFFEFLDLHVPQSRLVDVQRQNVRMNRRETLFLSQVPKQDMQLVKAVRSAVERKNIIHEDGLRNLMSPGQRSAFLSKFQTGNEAILKRYGLSEPSWTDPEFENDSDWSPPEPIEAAEYMAVLTEVLRLQ